MKQFNLLLNKLEFIAYYVVLSGKNMLLWKMRLIKVYSHIDYIYETILLHLGCPEMKERVVENSYSQ